MLETAPRPLGHFRWQTKKPRRVRADKGRYAILDNSVKNEHTEGTLVGDAFVIYAGLDDTPPETLEALDTAEVVGYLTCTARDPARPRVVTVADVGGLQRLVGAKALVATHAVGAAPTEEDRKPLHPYVYKRETACGIIIDVDDRCYERGDRVRAFVADCEAAAKRLPKNAVAAIRDAGCRIVVHEETGKWTHMCYHPRQGQSWLRDQGFDGTWLGASSRRLAVRRRPGPLGPGRFYCYELSHAATTAT